MIATASAVAAAGEGRLAGASLIGREHVRIGRNNQDGFALSRRGGVTVGVVTDGCSSQPRSEVGAQLSARFLASWVAVHAEGPSLPERATDALCAWLYRAVSELDADPTSFTSVVETYFLHTFLCAVRAGDDALVFGIGDGAVLIDDTLLRLDAGPDNAPPYVAYRLLTGRRPEPQVHFTGRARRLAVMTDGFEPVTDAQVRELAAGEGLWRNARTLQRRLNVLGEAEKLSDDATLVVLEGD
jgi:hypothetical protein